MSSNNQHKFIFFGSSNFSIFALDELQRLGFVPSLIVTTVDKPQGRKLAMSPNVVKTWAIKNAVPFLDPLKLDASFVDSLRSVVSKAAETDVDGGIQLFVVASYGRIIPLAVLAIPAKGTLNIHPSLLPKYRGPSPLPSAILDDEKHTGVTIMKVDEQMDHGPIVAAKPIVISEWPTYEQFEEMMSTAGAQLLADTIPKYLNGEIVPVEQDHSMSTYTKKIAKEDGLIDISDTNADQYLNFRKIQAFHEWPQAYFFAERNGKQLRVKVTSASFKNGKLVIEKVIPEGAREMSYSDFLRG